MLNKYSHYYQIRDLTGGLGPSSEPPTPTGLWGCSSQRGQESWGKLSLDPRPHLSPIRPGILPSLPPASTPSGHVSFLLPWGPLGTSPAKEAPLAAFKTSRSLAPFLLLFLLVLLILNTARRFAWFIILGRALPKSFLLNQLVCVF